jgi:hypothetical protein
MIVEQRHIRQNREATSTKIEPYVHYGPAQLSGRGLESCTASEERRGRPDMQEVLRILMRPDDMLETFSELAMREPDLMRLVL